jgi:hypothetical protein
VRWLQAALERALSHQHRPFGAHGGLSVLAARTAAQFDDIAAELGVFLDLDHQPFQENAFISKDGAPESQPE